MITITNRTLLESMLANLKPDTVPAFGTMTPQHMIEHLIDTVRFSNGVHPQELLSLTDAAEQLKQFFIYSDSELPTGVKSPLLPSEGLAPLKQPNLAAAITQLVDELAAFDLYFQQNPSMSPINPFMGALIHDEWITFHNKLFGHLFKQFHLFEASSL